MREFLEFVVRQLDTNADNAPVGRHLDEIALAPGVDRAWFFADPPPLPNRRAIPQEWLDLGRADVSSKIGCGR